MASYVSLRVRLSFWYTAIVTLSLFVFGVYTYFSVSKQLHSNLDASLLKVASSLDFIITQNQTEAEQIKNVRIYKQKYADKFAIFRENEKRRFVGPIRPSVEKMAGDDEGKDIEILIIICSFRWIVGHGFLPSLNGAAA